MIQRVQTIYLLVAGILNVISLFVPFWLFKNGTQTETIKGMEIIGAGTDSAASQSFMAWELAPTPLLAVFSGICVLASLWIIFDIFLFKNRKKQIQFAYFGVVFLMIELLVMVYMTLEGPYTIQASLDEGIVQNGLAFPFVSLVFVWLAIRNIDKDEKLVRSVDRIR